MARANKRGSRKLIYSTGQSNAIGTFSTLPLWFPQVIASLKDGSPVVPNGNQDQSVDPSTQLRFWNHQAFRDMFVVEGGAVANSTWLTTDVGDTDGSIHGHELGPGVMAVLKSWEWELDVDQHRWVAAAGGVGGELLADLGPGNVRYDEMQADVVALHGSLQEVEQSQIEAVALCMTHGSADAASGTTLATYRAGIEQLRQDWRDDMNAITGRADEPILTVDMHSFELGADTLLENQQRKAIHDALRNITDVSPNIYNCGARPTCGMGTADGIHYSSWADYQTLAEQHAKVIRRVTVDGDTAWKPLQFASITAEAGNIVRVTLEGGSGPAVLDPRPQRKAGFHDGEMLGFVYNDDGDARIRAVDVQASHIDIHLDGPPSTNPTLSHGFASEYLLGLTGLFPSSTWGIGNIYVRDSESQYKSFVHPNDGIWSWLCPFILEPVV